MKKGINLMSIRQVLAKIFRWFFPAKPPSLEFSGQKWDSEYSGNQWDYMKNISELGRYSMITGYLGHLKPDAAILEIGCGTGILFERLKHLPYQYYKGIDISEKAIESAQQLANEKTVFVAGNGAEFSDDQKYDVVIFNEALYYFDDCLAVLKHYMQMLKPGGFFIISMVVGDISKLHWEKIEKHYAIQDAVQTTNKFGITWHCRVVQPAAETSHTHYNSLSDQVVIQAHLQTLAFSQLDAPLSSFLKIIN